MPGDYQSLDNPYTGGVLRETSPLNVSGESIVSGSNSDGQAAPLTPDETKNNWLDGVTKSRNFAPLTHGFSFDGREGTAQFADVIIGRRGLRIYQTETGVNSSNAIYIENAGDYAAVDIRKSGIGDGIYIQTENGAGYGVDILQKSDTPGIHVVTQNATNDFQMPAEFHNVIAKNTNYYKMVHFLGGPIDATVVSLKQWAANNVSPNGILTGEKGDICQSSNGVIYLNVDGATNWVALWSIYTSPLTTLGDILSHDGSGAVRVAGDTSIYRRMLTQNGDGTNSALPVWSDPWALSLWGWGYSIQSDTFYAASLTGLHAINVNNALTNTTGFQATIQNTQTNRSFGFQANIGTSGFGAGLMVKGIGSESVAADSKHLILWDQELGGTNKVISVGNDTSNNGYKEKFFVQADGSVTLNPSTATRTAELRFKELAANGTSRVALRAPDSLSGDVTLTLPNSDGLPGQFLQTDGGGVLSWSYITTIFALTDAATIAVDWRDGNIQTVTLGGDRTFTFSNPIEGAKYMIFLTQDAIGSRAVTWPTIRWRGGLPPALTTTSTRVDIITLVYVGGQYFADTELNL